MNKFFKKSAMASVLAVAVLTMTACEHKISVPVDGATQAQSNSLSENSTFNEKAAYAIGASLGEYVAQMRSHQAQFIGELPAKDVIDGFSDGLNQQSALKREQIEAILKDLDKNIQEKIEIQARQAATENLEAGEKFLAENAKKEGVVTTKSGLQYKVIKQGEGATAKKGDVISVTYRGSTIDGAVFDEQKKPVEFPLDNMIPGWIEGLQLMNVGSEYDLYIPAKLGYGESAVGQLIKPNSVLIFNVKLEGIKEAPAKEESKKD